MGYLKYEVKGEYIFPNRFPSLQQSEINWTARRLMEIEIKCRVPLQTEVEFKR